MVAPHRHQVRPGHDVCFVCREPVGKTDCRRCSHPDTAHGTDRAASERGAWTQGAAILPCGECGCPNMVWPRPE